MTAADKYFLKARELYPYDMDEVVDAIEFGLSYDAEHAGLLTLRGDIYADDLHKYQAARECYELALFHDPVYTHAWFALIRLLLRLSLLPSVSETIEKAFTVPGINKAELFNLKARMYELQEDYIAASESVDAAYKLCQCADCYTRYKEDAERIQRKGKDLSEKDIRIFVTIK